MNDHQAPPPANLPGKSQPAHRKTDRVYPKRVPGFLTPEQQRDVVRQVRAGRSVHQVAADKSVSESVVLELWKRDTDRKTAEFLHSLDAKLQDIDEELRGRKSTYPRKAVA